MVYLGFDLFVRNHTLKAKHNVNPLNSRLGSNIFFIFPFFLECLIFFGHCIITSKIIKVKTID